MKNLMMVLIPGQTQQVSILLTLTAGSHTGGILEAENSIMKYKINFKNNFKVLRGVLIYHIILIAGYLYASYQYGDDDGIFRTVFGIHYGISMFPTIFLHIEYYIRNRRDKVKIDIEQNFITINNAKEVPFHQIEKIVLFMAPVWHRKTGIRYWPFESYRYARLQMKNGEQYIFTCLMAYDINETMAQIRGVKIDYKERLVATPLIN